VVGGVLGLALIGLAVFFLILRSRKSKQTQSNEVAAGGGFAGEPRSPGGYASGTPASPTSTHYDMKQAPSTISSPQFAPAATMLHQTNQHNPNTQPPPISPSPVFQTHAAQNVSPTQHVHNGQQASERIHLAELS
jgi:hypothetical protein